MYFAGLTTRAARVLGAGALLMTLAAAPAFAQAQPPAAKPQDYSAQQKKYVEQVLNDYSKLHPAEAQPGDDKKRDAADAARKAAAEALAKLGMLVEEQPAQPAPDVAKLREELRNLEIDLQ